MSVNAYIDVIKNKLSKPIVLVGMMGSGKSHVGSLLSRSFEIDFYDTDKVVESRAGCSVKDIFEKFGEERFRAAEQNTILDLLRKEKVCIIATGGGALVNPETLREVKAMSISVWLKADLETLVHRVSGNKKRPLLNNRNAKDVLLNLMKEREQFYAHADLHIETDPHSVETTVERSIKALCDFLNSVSV